MKEKNEYRTQIAAKKVERIKICFYHAVLLRFGISKHYLLFAKMRYGRCEKDNNKRTEFRRLKDRNLLKMPYIAR